MINIRITEAKRSEAVTEILNTRYKYPDLNILDILHFRYIEERTTAVYRREYNRLLIGNLKAIKNHIVGLLKGQAENINATGTEAQKHRRLYADYPDFFLLLIEQGIINADRVKQILQAENKTAYYKQLIGDINRKVSAILKTQAEKPRHSLTLWDIQQAENGHLTQATQYALYCYMRLLQARRNGQDTQNKSRYIQATPEIYAYMTGHNKSRADQIKPLIKHRLSRKIATKTAFLLFTSEADKTALLNHILKFIDNFKIIIAETQ